MNRREILSVSILIIIAAIACILLVAPYIIPPETGNDENTDKSDFDYLKTNIETVLTTIGDTAESGAEALSTTESMSAATEKQQVLDDLFSMSEYTMSYAVITPNGTITAVAPEAYSGSVGINIAGSEPGKTIIRTQEPLLSDAFIAQEGFTGIEIAWPISSQDGVYKGSVLAMANPSEFVREIVAPVEEEKDITVTVMQPDGFILYDQDTAQVGKNLFEDVPFTRYQSLQALGMNISATATGNGEYTFYSSPDKTGESVKKHADWDTVSYLNK